MAGEGNLSAIGESVSQTVATQVEAVTEIAGNAIENAERRADAADELSEKLTEAALRDRVVQEVHETQRRMEEWRGQKDHEIASLSEALAGLQTSLSKVTDQLALLAGVTIASTTAEAPGWQQPTTDQSSLSQEISEALELPVTDPTSLSVEDVAESPAQAIAKRTRRLI